jgi:hypothetical protein
LSFIVILRTRVDSGTALPSERKRRKGLKAAAAAAARNATNLGGKHGRGVSQSDFGEWLAVFEEFTASRCQCQALDHDLKGVQCHPGVKSGRVLPRAHGMCVVDEQSSLALSQHP